MEASAEKEHQTQKGFLVDLEVKNPPASAGDMGSIPDPGRSHIPETKASPRATLLSLCSRARVHNARSPPAPTAEAQRPRGPLC